MECEIRDRNKTKVFNSSDWYGYIWRKLTSHWNIADFTKNQVSFITFNYDRSLEKFLYNTLKHTYGRTEQETMQAFYSIPIIHVHGSLGDAVSLGKKSAPDYGAGFSTSTDLLASANNIKIIHDQMDDSVEFENAITLLKGAQKIIIIGLGYDETNMKRLNIKPNSYRMIHGSSFGLTDMECAEYNSKFGVQFHKSGRNKKALMFLRESLILN